jgi:hypothetical protein
MGAQPMCCVRNGRLRRQGKYQDSEKQRRSCEHNLLRRQHAYRRVRGSLRQLSVHACQV